jgi:hypothetical protein
MRRRFIPHMPILKERACKLRNKSTLSEILLKSPAFHIFVTHVTIT